MKNGAWFDMCPNHFEITGNSLLFPTLHPYYVPTITTVLSYGLILSHVEIDRK